MSQVILQSKFDKLNQHFAGDLQPRLSRLETTIRKAGTFRQVLDHGYKVVSKEAIFFFFEDAQLKTRQETEYGIIASKAVGGAVERNRCKRLLREAFRQTLSRNDNPLQGLKIVAIARKACVDVDLNRVLTSLVWAINRYADRKGSGG